jgi:hypothetical protein
MGRIIKLQSSSNYSLALDEYGILWGWGLNNQTLSNQTYSNTNTDKFTTPTKIELPGPVTRFAAGEAHALALGRDGQLWAWGSNAFGQLGNGQTAPVSGVVSVLLPTTMTSIVDLAASSSTSYAVDANGKVWAWGNNDDGEVGNGTYSVCNSPVAVSSSSGMPLIKLIKANHNFALALANDGTIWTWGDNTYGQLGHSNGNPSNIPLKITVGLSLGKSIATGYSHSLGISPAGNIWSWGRNNYGQLGTNTSSNSLVPLPTAAVTGWNDLVQISCGAYHSLGLRSDGYVWTWGNNSYGQLGFGNTTNLSFATKINTFKLSDDDTDNDGLADSWERFYFNSLTQTASGIFTAGGVDNITAYARGLSPLLTDEDGDGISNALELATPGLDPLDWTDASGDLDADSVPNLWEQAMGSNMTNLASIPATTVTVNNNQSIQTVINALAGNSTNPPFYRVIVQPGLYSENIILPADKRVALISANAGGIPEIRGLTAFPTVTIYGESVIDGFRITHSPGVAGEGILSQPNTGRAIVRLVNCFIHDHTDTAVRANTGRTILAHCTIFNNIVPIQTRVISIASLAKLTLANSIVWNPINFSVINTVIGQVGGTGRLECRQSIVRDGSALGALTIDPGLMPKGYIAQSSVARGRGNTPTGAGLDAHHEFRGPLPDLGADQFTDSDTDALPDWWEMAYFGNLSQSATDDHESPQPDRLSNIYEWLLGFNPNLSNTLSNGKGDLYNAVFESTSDSHYPPEWLADDDYDGLSNGKELYYLTNVNNQDTNGDRLTDGLAVLLGLSPTSADTDSDGISNLAELANGTSPLLADTDGDGVSDYLDPLPLDPSISSLPNSSPSDVTAPLISLQQPAGAVLQP